MSTNEIILLAIVVIIGFILVFGVYYGYVYFTKNIKHKKVDSIFSPENLVEEESLMNSMDEKRNVEFKSNDNFVSKDVPVKLVENKTTDNKQINPFGVNLTKTTTEGRDYIKEEEQKAGKKYFK